MTIVSCAVSSPSDCACIPDLQMKIVLVYEVMNGVHLASAVDVICCLSLGKKI